MINKKPLKFFNKFEENGFYKPLYKDYSFARLPSTIYFLLTGKKEKEILPVDCFGTKYPHPKKIVLFFIDAFGYEFWEKYYKKFKITKKIVEEGTLTSISSVFPSSTAPSVTTLSLDSLPLQHGLIEWFLYIDEYDEVIKSLPFSPLGESTRDSCLNLGFDPKFLMKFDKTIYERLNKFNIKSYRFGSKEISNSVYDKLSCRGSVPISFSFLPDGLEKVKETLDKDEKMFVYFYWDKIDTSCHISGPNSKEHKNQIKYFWENFEKSFSKFNKNGETLFLFTADHGQAKVDPKKIIFLNKKFPEIVDYLKHNKKGKIIYPTGIPRDVFLHVKEEKVEECFKMLSEKLKDFAKVLRTEKALDLGLFGNPPFDKVFVERLGQILILPYKDICVWWDEENVFDKYKGYNGLHGGLSKEELITALGVY